MSKYHWRESPDVVARLVNLDKIQTYFSRQVTLKPNEAAVFLVEGKIGNAITGKTVRDIGGGFSRFLGDILKLTADDRRIIFAMTGPMDIWIPFNSQIKDGSAIKGHLNLRLQISEDNIPKLLNIFSNQSSVLTRDGVVKILQTEVNSRLIEPVFSNIEHNDELRQNSFQSIIESIAETELRPILSVIGMKLLSAFAIIGKTDYERILQLRAEMRNATQIEGENAKALAERIEIREQSMLRRIECEVNIAKAKARGEVDVDLEKELKDLRVKEAHWQSELNKLREKSEILKSINKNKTENAMKLFESVQEAKRLRINNQHSNEKEIIEQQNIFQEKMMQLAAQNDALDPSVMNTLLEQQSAQKAIGKGMNHLQSVKSETLDLNCQNCGKSRQKDWLLCPYCGHDFRG